MVQYVEEDNRLIKKDLKQKSKDKTVNQENQEHILEQYGLSKDARILKE